MAIFNGTDYTLADFTAGDGFGYVEIWDGFWPDVLTEMTNRAAAIGAGLVAISTSSVTIGSGSKSFDVGTGKGFVANMWVTATDVGNSANSLTGSVTSYNSATGMLVLSVPAGATTGSGTIAAWTLGIGGKPGSTGPTGPITTYWGGTAGGTANALTATTGSSLSSLTRGQIVGVKTGASANSGASTLAVDSVPAIAIRKNGSATVGGDLPANSDLWFQYDGTYLRLLGGSGGAGLVAGVLTKSANYSTVAADNKYLVKYTAAATHTLLAAATAGGTFTQIIKAAGGAVSIAAAAGETVNNTAAYSLAQGTSALITSDGVSAYELVLMPAVTTASASTCAWNAADVDASLTLSNGNLTITSTAGGQRAGRANKSISSGNYYYEFGTVVADGCQIGFGTSSASLMGYLGIDANGWGFGADGKKWNNNTGTAYGSTWNTGTHRIGIFAKSTATNVFSIWVSVDGIVQGGGDPVAGTSPMFSGVSGPLFPLFGDNSGTSASAGTAYFTAASWMYVPSTIFQQIP
jgi:hypothetical protein